MAKHRFLLLGLFLLLLAVDWSLADSQVNENGKPEQHPSLNEKSKGDVSTNSSKDDKGSNKSTNQGIDDKGSNKSTNQGIDDKDKKNDGVDDLRNNRGNKGKEDRVDGTDGNDLGAQARGKGTVDGAKGGADVNRSGLTEGNKDSVKGNDSGGKVVSESKDGRKDKGKDVVSKDNVPKDESVSIDQCDPSATCMIEKKKFVACLRQTGNEFPEFSFLIRNNGEKPLQIAISGPDFVHLENKTFPVKGKDKQKVKMKVETNRRAGNSLIAFQVGKETCNLNITELVAHISEKEVDISRESSAVNFFWKAPTIAVISFAAILIIVSAWTCVSLRRKLLSKNDHKYQRIEMELPVSAARQTEPDSNYGWDDNWGDDWGDEEAPLTPSVQLTPTLSSKGLASRRLNKEGWKD